MVYNSDMTDVWYPGRPPLRSPEIIEGLTHYVAALEVCGHQCAPEYLEMAEKVGQHILDVLEEESADCLGSDTDTNELIEMLPETFKAAVLCVQHGQWDDLEDITASVDAVRWALINKLEAATEGADNGRGTASPPPPETPGRAAPWTHGSEDAEQKHWAEGPTPDQLQAEEALPGVEEDANGIATDQDTRWPELESSPQPPPPSDEEERDPPRTA